MRSKDLLYRRCYTKNITFSKTMASQFLGSRSKLEQLVAEGSIRMEKPNPSQNGKWRVNAGDVLYQILKYDDEDI